MSSPSTLGAGVIVVKEQTFHADASAHAVAYKKYMDINGPFIKIETGKSVLTIDKSKVAGRIELNSEIPLDITTESELKPLRDNLKELQDFSRRYPKSAPLLVYQVASLDIIIKKVESGEKRMDGEWLNEKQIENIKRNRELKITEARHAREKEIEEAKRIEENRLAEQKRSEENAISKAKEVETRRKKSLELQRQALEFLKSGNLIEAESRLINADKEFPSKLLSDYAKALVLFNKLSQEKSLHAIDNDWKKPILPDPTLFTNFSDLIVSLRSNESIDIYPDLVKIGKGLEAAELLGTFSKNCCPNGLKDELYPLRALQILRITVNYSNIKTEDSLFVKPFLNRLKALDNLIDPKLKEYETLLTQAKELESDKKYLDAALKYRLAISIEHSRNLEKTIESCESKASGL
jgi:hypothetical protein